MSVGTARKLQADALRPVEYHLPLGDVLLPLNPLLGRTLRLCFSGEIHCIACHRLIPKTYQQGYCFPCSQRLAECDICRVRPERCHFAQGNCREPAWGLAHCMQPHYVYFANSSGLKVGMTRLSHAPTRWLDQGAVQALPIFQVATRYQAGLLETALAQQVADKTDWQALLKGEAEPLDLSKARDTALAQCATALAAVRRRLPPGSAPVLRSAETLAFRYPVLRYPEKIHALNFDKTPTIQGTLLGIKGQYLLLDCGVLNIRKFAGYQIDAAAI